MKSRDLKVYVHGPGAFSYQAMFLKAGFKGTPNLDEADIVCFTGGEDVSPSLYGENNLKLNNRNMSFCNADRDDRDAIIHGYAVANKQFQIGICRGGQFLNVMNGGKMWQHVNGHTGGPHELIDNITGEVVLVTSTHHQMMRPGEDAEILAVAKEATYKMAEKDTWTEMTADKLPSEWNEDIEVLWYPGTRSLCFQPHPEFSGHDQCTEYFMSLIERLIA